MTRSNRNNNNHHTPSTIDPSQDQSQVQAELQAQLQAQLEAQAQDQDQKQDQDQDQKQDQDQDQKQGQDQGQWQHSSSENLNGNLNGNVNLNGSSNENVNVNENTSTTDVNVNVDVDLDLDTPRVPDDADFADIDMKDVDFDNIFMTNGGGDISFDPGDDVNFENIFNNAFGTGDHNTAFAVNQIADLVDNDNLSNVQQNNGGTFDMTWDSAGGDSSTGDGFGIGDADGKDGWSIDAGDDIAASAASSAASSLSSTAFTQEIVLGANLQQNAVDVSVVGGNNNYTSVGGDDAEA
ncbi:hypothetical protein [Devosia sp. MC1541]|uniref:hypothetical protein n=1 Tax=Devosia sp. MC1541 TaxID=2725264 RepID=UPI00145F5DB9|nr:hypothetical protein [Devosia sp. MC1541]